MSTLPGLEAALDAAAHRHYGRRRRRFTWSRLLVPALTLACVIAAVVALPARTGRPALERPAGTGVPEATLTLSHALAQAPGIPKFTGREPVITHADLPAVADSFKRATPYPPGEPDAFDWASTAVGPSDMASINYAQDVQSLVEFRAACIWLRFWLANAADPEALQGAGAVLGDVPSWPSMRDRPGGWASVPALLAANDVAALGEQNQRNCTPWSDRQGG